MLCRALRKGYDGAAIRDPSDVPNEFEMPDGVKGSWFEPIPEDEQDEPKRKPGRPAKTKD